MKHEGLSGKVRAGFLAAAVLMTGAGCIKNGKFVSPPNLVPETKLYSLPKHPSCSAVITDPAGTMDRMADTRRQITVDVTCPQKGSSSESSLIIAKDLIETLQHSGLPFDQRELAPAAKGNSWGVSITTKPAEAIEVWRKNNKLVPHYRP